MISSSVCLSVLFLRRVRADRSYQKNMHFYKFHVLSITGMFFVSFATVSTICFPIRYDMCLSRFFRFTEYLLLTFKFRIFGRGFPRCGELVVLF